MGEYSARRVREIVERDLSLRRSLRPLRVLLDRATEKIVRCRLVRDDGLQRTMLRPGQRNLAFHALVAKRSGVFFMRPPEDAFCDRAVVVNASNGVKIDSEESCPLVISAPVSGSGVRTR